MNALAALLRLPAEERRSLGVEHTAAEISQQPGTWSETLSLCRRQKNELQQFLTVEPGRRVLLVGAGTSDFIGKSVERLLENRWRVPVSAVASTELLTGMNDWFGPTEPALCISFSRSGDSSEGVAVIEELLRQFPRVKQLVITCNSDGAMARLMDRRPQGHALLLGPDTNDRGLAMTSSFSNMVIAAQALAYLDDLESYSTLVQHLAASAEHLLPQAADVAAELAKQNFTRVCFLGSGALAATAAESALKVQELTAGRIFTMSQSFLGLRHGPLSFINDETLVVAYISSDEQTRQYEMDLLRELDEKNLGAATAAVGFALPAQPAGSTRITLELAGTAAPDALRPPLDVIFGQLLGLFCSLEAGLKPDTPSPTGAISRVVSHVRIHSSQPVAHIP